MKRYFFSLILFVSFFITLQIHAMLEPSLIQSTRNNIYHASLIEATEQGNLEVVKEFIEEKNTPINIKDEQGYTLLHIATLYNHPYIVKYILKKEQKKEYIDAQTDEGKTALYIACERNIITIAKQLITWGANVNFSSPKLVYCRERIDLGIPDYTGHYLDNHADTYSKTPLHIACTKGHVKLTKVLLKNDIPRTIDPQENFQLTRNINNILNDIRKFRYQTSLLGFHEHYPTSLPEKVNKIVNANKIIDIYLPLTIKQIIKETFSPVVSHEKVKAIIQLIKALQDNTIPEETVNTAFDGVAGIYNQISPEQLSAFLSYIVSRITRIHTNDTLFLDMAHAYHTLDNFLEIERPIIQDKTDRADFLLKDEQSFKTKKDKALQDVRLQLVIGNKKELDKYKKRYLIPHAFLGESKLLQKIKKQEHHSYKIKKLADIEPSICTIL